MSIQLNHTIVASVDKEATARFWTEILGLTVRGRFGPFVQVRTANGVDLDFASVPEADVKPQHYAFLVSETEFDAAFAEVRRRGLEFRGDPHGGMIGEINHNDGGRGVYFEDPNGHFLELLTVPYGGWDS